MLKPLFFAAALVFVQPVLAKAPPTVPLAQAAQATDEPWKKIDKASAGAPKSLTWHIPKQGVKP